MAEDDDLDALLGRIPAACTTTTDMKCCCGRTDCSYLKHNSIALENLEEEVRTAATLGQVSTFLSHHFLVTGKFCVTYESPRKLRRSLVLRLLE